MNKMTTWFRRNADTTSPAVAAPAAAGTMDHVRVQPTAIRASAPRLRSFEFTASVLFAVEPARDGDRRSRSRRGDRHGKGETPVRDGFHAFRSPNRLRHAGHLGLPRNSAGFACARFGFLASIVAAALIVTMASAARADVIEIGKNGSTIIRASDAGWSGQARDDEAGTTELADADVPNVPAAALTTIAAPIVPAAVHASFERAAAQANVNPALLEALVWKESRWRPNAVSPKGALGLTQLMPGTARDLLVDPRDYSANLAGGARYLRRMLDMFDGDIEKALAAYNAGPGRVRMARGIPAIAETRSYVASIMDRLGGSAADLVEGASR